MLTRLATWMDEGLASQETQQSDVAARRAMDVFLAGVEKKAFVIAKAQLRHHDDALDVVQDAMLRLVRGYATKPEAEWTPLFFRILTNRIRDLQRKRTVRNRVMSWFSGATDEEGEDEIQRAPDPAGTEPAELAEAEDTYETLEAAVAALPARQRQAFLLRSLEELDTAATANAMDCSEGSVKTHYSRALNALRTHLEKESC